MKKEQRNTPDLSVVDTNDKQSKSAFRLIRKPVGSITYEHSLAERFYNDIYIGSAERNYYVDDYHELCLCAHFNRRVPGKYEFVPEWQFFVTKQRMCLDIYWNLGNISDESMIIEKYVGIEDALKSRYGQDFLDLKGKIDESIKWCRDHQTDPYDGGSSSFQYSPSHSTGTQYTIFEYSIKDRREVVQFYLNNEDDNWELLSVSKEPLSEMMRFFKDFEELDKNELHLRTFLPIQEYAIEDGAIYHKSYVSAVRFNEIRHLPLA